MSSKPTSVERLSTKNVEKEEEENEANKVVAPATGEEPQLSVNAELIPGVEESKSEDANVQSSPPKTSTPAAHRSNATTKIDSMYSTVVIEDIGASDSADLKTLASVGAASEHGNANPDIEALRGVAGPHNNNMALIPRIASKTSQMIPIALLRKSSNGTSADDCSIVGAGTGIMHLITGNNKVAPEKVPGASDSVTSAIPPTTVGAVLMLIPKKSDSVCVDIPNADFENNPPLDSNFLEHQADCSCRNNQNDAMVVRPTQSYDSYEDVCRICHDNPSKMELISPCLCKGSMSKVHRACLERWLAESAKNSCEICNYEYNTVRKPKFKGCNSVYQWIRNPLSPSDMRNLCFDIACFFILTPLAAISSWLCVVGAQHYTFDEDRRRKAKYQNEASALWDVHRPDPRGDASNATWTAVGLLSLTGTLLVAYSVWLFVAIKYHIQAWKEWQQRNYTVTIVPFEDGCMGRPPPPRPPRNPSNNNNGNLIGASDNGHISTYNFDANPNLLRYSGHNSVMRGRGGRNIFRQNRHSRRNYNLPPIFSRSHFLRNPPPGYTISETTLLYQALYGSDSDAFLNENFLAFFADSSDDVTESSSQANAEHQHLSNFGMTTATLSLPTQERQGQGFNELPEPFDMGNVTVEKEESTGFSTTIDEEFPSCSNNANNNPLLNEKKTEKVASGIGAEEIRRQTSPEKQNTGNNVNDHVVSSKPCADDDGNN